MPWAAVGAAPLHPFPMGDCLHPLPADSGVQDVGRGLEILGAQGPQTQIRAWLRHEKHRGFSWGKRDIEKMDRKDYLRLVVNTWLSQVMQKRSKNPWSKWPWFKRPGVRRSLRGVPWPELGKSRQKPLPLLNPPPPSSSTSRDQVGQVRGRGPGKPLLVRQGWGAGQRDGLSQEGHCQVLT